MIMIPRVNGQIPFDVELASMIGQECLAFTVGKSHIELLFTDMRLTVEFGYEIFSSAELPRSFFRGNLAAGASYMPTLITRNILTAKWVAGKGLLIDFTGGIKFTAISDDSGFESFSFDLPGEPGIVVV